MVSAYHRERTRAPLPYPPMKALSIILTCALLVVMGWIIFDSKSQLKGSENQLELLRRQQPAKPATAGSDSQLAAMETQLLAEQMQKNVPAPSATAASLPTAPAP